jgi:hypothetical protein
MLKQLRLILSATNPADVTPAWSVSKPLEMYFTEPMNAASVKAGTFVTYDIPAGLQQR